MNPITYNFTGAIQNYTVPVTGLYTIVASGAQGGRGDGSAGGLGAAATGEFALQEDDRLLILVGGAGQNGFGEAGGAGGGGGGTFVFVDVDPIGTITGADRLLVGAGGGGGGGYNVLTGIGGYSADDPSGSGAGGAGGTVIGSNGAGGAGINGGGGNGNGASSGTGAPSIQSNGVGNPSTNGAGGDGGYGGGGGGGFRGGGGGGGYTGGDGGRGVASSGRPGDGGRSYIDETAVSRSSTGAVMQGDGQVGITATCYCTGTLIRTTRGEVAVETLAIGDHVVTASGEHRPIKWIGTRSYAPRFANANPEALLPVCFKTGSIADGVPARDLWVSPKHAMFLDGVLIPAASLVNGVSIVKAERVDNLGYWHIELESHDVLIAEGAPSESFVDDEGRGIFHNAHEFHALYPDARPVEAVYCAPRVEDGYVLEAVSNRLAARAGLHVARPEDFGVLRGYVEGCDGETVWGWAQDAAYPDAPVCLDVLVDGVLVVRLYADAYRADLAAAGIGDGCHAFSLGLPRSPTGHASPAILVRRSADSAALTDLRTIEPLGAAA